LTFKSFSQSQYLSQYTENKSIYLKMNRFILALFMFENIYISQVNHEIMQIDFPDTHTLILGVILPTTRAWRNCLVACLTRLWQLCYLQEHS